MNDQETALAQKNLLALSRNPYPGRGIVAGLDMTGYNMVQIYWIMGRSPNSRNRIFKADDKGRVYTEAADPSKVKDPSLIIYNAMREQDLLFVVSNGAQTDAVVEKIWKVRHLDVALSGWKYEPDAPNFTPRITAVTSLGHNNLPYIQMSILRASQFGCGCDRSTYVYAGSDVADCLRRAAGYCITTYSGDGDPLPAFRGDPLLMPLDGKIGDIAQTYWDALNEANRVALAVKFIGLNSGKSKTHIINQYEQVE